MDRSSKPVRARRPGSAFLLAAVLLVLLAGRVPAQTTEHVAGVVLQGVHSLDPDIIRRSIETKSPKCRSPLLILVCRLSHAKWAEQRDTLDRAKVQGDVQRILTLYEIWGFPDAQVTSELSQRGHDVVVTFDVTEHEPIVVRSLQVRGAERVAGFEVPDLLPLQEGEPYALPRLRDTELVLRRALGSLGYPLAQIEVSGNVVEPAREADIVLQIEPGRVGVFGDTRIQAQAPITDHVVRRRLAYDEGDRFSADALERTERNLYQLPITRRVTAQPVGVARNDSIVDMGVRVDATRVHGFAGDVLLSSTDCAEVRGYWQNRYAFGGPSVFALGVYASNLLAKAAGGDFPCSATGEGIYAEPQYGVEADVRSFIGRSGMLILRGFAQRESSPNVYVQKGYGGQLTVASALSRTLDGELSYQPERNRLLAADLYFCGQYGICTDSALASFITWKWQAPAEAVLLWRSTNAPPDVRRPDPGPGHDWPALDIPVQRWRARGGFALAGNYSGSDYTYRRGLLEVTTTRLLGSGFELAARTRAGIVSADEVLPPRALFFSGGPNTVRGVAQNLLGPKVLSTRMRPLVCTPVCPPSTVVDPDEVTARPTGGESVLEGNLELRVWLGSRLQLAAFVDAGRVVSTDFSAQPSRAEGNVTPGIGIRILTDLGPVRVDLGYDGSGARRYPLFLQENGSLTPLGDVIYDPFTFDQPSFLRETYRRLQLQMAIGQAF